MCCSAKMTAAQAGAFVEGRDYLVPDDVKGAAPAVLSHRVIVKSLNGGSDPGRSETIVREILETGANDVYIVGRESGRDLLLPAITSVVRRIDPEAGTVVVRLMPGLE